MEVAHGVGAVSLPADPLRRDDMAARRTACGRLIAQGRERTAAAASAFRSARSLAEGNVACVRYRGRRSCAVACVPWRRTEQSTGVRWQAKGCVFLARSQPLRGAQHGVDLQTCAATGKQRRASDRIRPVFVPKTGSGLRQPPKMILPKTGSSMAPSLYPTIRESGCKSWRELGSMYRSNRIKGTNSGCLLAEKEVAGNVLMDQSCWDEQIVRKALCSWPGGWRP